MATTAINMVCRFLHLGVAWDYRKISISGAVLFVLLATNLPGFECFQSPFSLSLRNPRRSRAHHYRTALFDYSTSVSFAAKHIAPMSAENNCSETRSYSLSSSP